MSHISEFINSIQKIERYQFRGDFDFDTCRNAYVEIARAIVPNWTDKNPELTDQMIYYSIGSDKFKGDLNKGLILMGSTGTGKTVILKTLSLLFGYMFRFRFIIYTGWDMESVYSVSDVSDEKHNLERQLSAKMFGIDDLGEEHATIKVYGTDINVGIDALTKRHLEFVNKGHLTFITTNLNADMILKKYGARIESRVYEMCNLIGVKGDDIRKGKQ